MELKLMCLLVFFLGVVLNYVGAALHSRPLDDSDFEVLHSSDRGLKCLPGRTVLKFAKKQDQLKEKSDSDQETRREHMTKKSSDATCRICVCSAEGKDEYCSNRLARNVNECITIAKASQNLLRPFDHTKVLQNMIRRFGEYIWHKDEIPYDPKAKCKRGFSYYSNSITANDTDIDVGSDVESLIGYNNPDICYFCICSVHGKDVGCIKRDPWVCEYYRAGRDVHNFGRNLYTTLFQQDRPAYFRQLSFRLRRNMDMSLSEYFETANRGLKRPSCIPFASEYNDCNKKVGCKGCTRCTCNADGQWMCYKAFDTCGMDDGIDIGIGDPEMDLALSGMVQEMKVKTEQEKQKRPRVYVPAPPKKVRKTTTAAPLVFQNIEERVGYELRSKRSLNKKSHNDTKTGIKFYNTIDEINEDTLKHSNISGTLGVKKVDVFAAKASRRAGVLVNSSQNPLHIVYNEPKVNNHITDNKIEFSLNEDKYDVLNHEQMAKLKGNYTQKSKNKEVSKLVVNELISGTETIGDPKGPILSNITFTPENDTLTAMAFIAGDLLNRLWNMEKNSNHDSIETELMKHEKISDLLELFKEPMTYRQERFLKEALEKLAAALNKQKDIKNVSLCETVEEVKKELNSNRDSGQPCDSRKNDSQKLVLVNALSKVQNVLNLITKLEAVQKKIEVLKESVTKPLLQYKSSDEQIKDTDVPVTKDSEGFYGNIMKKITNILAPPKSKREKKKLSGCNNAYNNKDLIEQVQKTFNIDLENSKMSAKDKMILDYINTMQTNPCLLSKPLEEPLPIRNVESNILLNLSEFFKIKSFSDLLNMVDPEKQKVQTSPPTTTSPRTTAIDRLLKTSKVMSTFTEATTPISPALSLKDKLKSHLKAIINDLIEIHRERGNNLKPGDVNIADALPCIVNMFKEDKSLEKPSGNFRTDLMNKVKSVLDMVRKETKKLPPSRRNFNAEPRPTAAVVWERVVKNLGRRGNTRRNFKPNEPKSYEEVKALMARIDAESSNTYKNFAFLKEVPAAEKLVLLQTLELDVDKYVDVLEKLQTLEYEKKIPKEQLDDVLDFIDSAGESIKLNEKVLKNLDNTKQKRFKVQKNIQEKPTVVNPTTMLGKQVLNEFDDSFIGNENTKLSRNQLLHQLIKNRVVLYLKIKESQGVNLNDDIKYNIAKRIIENLDNGNHKLAQELFSIFVGSKRPVKNNPVQSPFAVNLRNTPLDKKQTNPMDSKWAFPDLLLTHFLNIKNS